MNFFEWCISACLAFLVLLVIAGLYILAHFFPVFYIVMVSLIILVIGTVLIRYNLFKNEK